MEERRFDDLTRALGRGASRRQVLKGLAAGLIGGLLGRAAVPSVAGAALPAGCNEQACEQRASNDWLTCNASCKKLACRRPRPFGAPNVCFACRATCMANYEFAVRECRAHGCSGGEQCCRGQCTDLRVDPNNCGSCDHACPDGDVCSGGECQCADNLTACDGKCIDTQNDHDNCGGCGHACTGCEICSDGQCTSICTEDAPCCNDQCVSTQCDSPTVFNPVTCVCECPGGNAYCDGQCVDIYNDDQHCGSCVNACRNCEVCVHGACTPLNCGTDETCCDGRCLGPCPDNAQRDPETCECKTCKGQIDGSACGTNEVCCQEQCLSNQCPSGKAFSLDTCSCQCTTNCPSGQLQDPETCACQDLCASKTCGECTTCDPSSGDCVPVDDQTPCGTNQVCCSGTCQDTCDCPDGQRCETDPSSSSDICCPAGETCGAESNESGYSKCCPTANFCQGFCCEANETCLPQGFCCAGDRVTSDNSCCQSYETVCGATCCDASYQTCIAGACCNTTMIDRDGNCCSTQICSNGECCAVDDLCGSISGEPQHCIPLTPV